MFNDCCQSIISQTYTTDEKIHQWQGQDLQLSRWRRKVSSQEKDLLDRHIYDKLLNVLEDDLGYSNNRNYLSVRAPMGWDDQIQSFSQLSSTTLGKRADSRPNLGIVKLPIGCWKPNSSSALVSKS